MSDDIHSYTGHRPDKLGGYSERTDKALRKLVHRFYKKIKEKPDKGIVGMALGFDMAVAEVLIELDIPFIAAVPFEGFESRWPLESQKRYHHILKQAGKVKFISKKFHMGTFQLRNEWMVNHSNSVIALWNGDTSGGTYNCVKYAEKTKKPVINIWDLWSKP